MRKIVDLLHYKAILIFGVWFFLVVLLGQFEVVFFIS